MTFTDDTEKAAGRIFLEAWKRRLGEKQRDLFALGPEQMQALMAERRAFRLAEAVWKEGCEKC